MFDLDEIARGATTAVADHRPSVSDLSERVHVRQQGRQTLVGAGAVFTLLVVVIGAWALTRSPNASVDTADGRVDADGNVVAAFDPTTQVPDPWDAVVFMTADADPEELEGVRVLLDGSAEVTDFTFVTKQQTYEEFVEFFAGDPGILETIAVETMPPSFRVAIDDLDDPILAAIAELSGIRTILGPDGELPEPITVFGSPVFDRRASVELFLTSRAGYDEAFRRCMAEKGFDSVESPSGSGRWPDDYVRAIDQADDLEYAQEWGFAFVSVNEADRGAGRPDPNVEVAEGYEKAAFGGELFGDGCAGDAGDVWNAGEQSLNNSWEEVVTAQRAFAADERVIAHYEDWSTCMSDNDHDYSSPFAAYNAAGNAYTDWKTGREQTTAVVLEEEESAIAVATVECGASASNLVSLQLANVWDEYADGDWDEERFLANSPECEIRFPLATRDQDLPMRNNPELEACFD